MQTMGHQVVGSKDKTHEDVKLMYEKLFGGESQIIKKSLRKTLNLSPIQFKQKSC